MQASERRIERLESDLALIADQEKLIVSQLTHIDSSKQKLLTIIENSTEVMDEDLYVFFSQSNPNLKLLI